MRAVPSQTGVTVPKTYGPLPREWNEVTGYDGRNYAEITRSTYRALLVRSPSQEYSLPIITRPLTPIVVLSRSDAPSTLSLT